MADIEFANSSGVVICDTVEEAFLYCQFYEQHGKRDWRLPTNDEIDAWYVRRNIKDDMIYWADTDSNYPSYIKDKSDWYVIPVRDIIDESV